MIIFIAGIYSNPKQNMHLAFQSYGTRQTKLLAGPRLNIKTVLSTYGDFHVKDKTAVRTSYL